MGLVLKHVQTTKAGTLHYRRKIPKELCKVIGRREFKRLLGATPREALLAYPKINAEFERLLAEARKPGPVSPQPRALDAFVQARERIADIEAALPKDDTDTEWRIRDAYAEGVLARYPQDPETGEPVGVPEVERLVVNGVRSGRVERPDPTLEDAKRLYIQERVVGDASEAPRTARLERVMRYLTTVLGTDRCLSKIERWDAREVRDHMLSDLGMTPATVRRYMNDIRAMVTHGIKEFGLRGVENPFDRLPIRVETVAKDERKPFTADQLKAARGRVLESAGDDLRRIWRLLEGTGCRLAEITGLMMADVFAEHKQPYLDIVFHAHRRLKNRGSVRRVPLVGDALLAAKEALKAAGDGALLFPNYGRKRGADAASAALMKHVRAVVSDPKVVVHSLRHNMEDRLIVAGASEFDRNLILGHSQGGMGERYGGPDARLDAATLAMQKAFPAAAK